MSIAVPRRAEAVVSVAAAARGERSLSRAVALEEARRAVLDAIAGGDQGMLAAWCELAAVNVDCSALVVCELLGQGAHGVCRSFAWHRRNGRRVERGRRGFAVSMFGGYVYPVAGGRGGVGVPVATGDALGDVIVAARAGERIRAVWSEPEWFSDEAPVLLAADRVPVVPASVDVGAWLEAALDAARAAIYAAAECVSCDGAGCVLCSSADDPIVNPRRFSVPRGGRIRGVAEKPKRRSRRVVKAAVKRGVGRPRVERPRIVRVRELADEAAVLRARLEQAEAMLADAMLAEWDSHSIRTIADSAGLTATAAWRIVTRRQREVEGR